MKLASRMITGIVVVLLMALVMLFAGVRLLGLTPFAVLSGSMEPLYPVGSLIYVQETDPAQIEPGDAVTFTKGSGVVATHQAYEVDAASQLIRTQGIANINADGSVMKDAEPVPFANVIGVPVACIPLLGYVNSFVTSPGGSFVVIAAAVVLIVLSIVLGPSSRKASPAQGRHMRR